MLRKLTLALVAAATAREQRTMAVAESIPATTDKGQVILATHSDRGTERETNEDACGTYVESPNRVLAIVADGVSGYEGKQNRVSCY